jgi:hypothetical protein
MGVLENGAIHLLKRIAGLQIVQAQERAGLGAKRRSRFLSMEPMSSKITSMSLMCSWAK